MAHRSSTGRRWPTPPGWPTVAVTHATGIGFAGLLGVVVLGSAAGGPEGLFAWRIASAFLLFAATLMFGRRLLAVATVPERLHALLALAITYLVGGLTVFVLEIDGSGPGLMLLGRLTSLALVLAGLVLVGVNSLVDDADPERPPVLLVARAALVVTLLVALYTSGRGAIGPGIHRVVDIALLLVAVVALCVLAGDPREYDPLQWVGIGCFAVVASLLFYHTLAFAPSGTPARRPLWAALLAGLNLFVLPQYVSRERFLWASSRLAAALVLVALPIYVIGEYSLFGLQVRFHGGYVVPVVGYELQMTRSIFVNRNTFATVVLAGLVASLAEVHRAYDGLDTDVSILTPTGLLGITALGWVIGRPKSLSVVLVMPLGIYLLYMAFGRRAIPDAVLLAGLYLFGGILGVYLGLIPIDPGARGHLWRAGARAMLDQPTLFGEGYVHPREYIAPYHDIGNWSPHNSYVVIYIYTGIVGVLAYAGIVGASLLRGVIRFRQVDVAILALAVGFAAHQLFESYLLFGWRTGTVLAALSIGFLLFGYSEVADPDVGVSDLADSEDADSDTPEADPEKDEEATRTDS